MIQQALYFHWVCYACKYKLLDFSYELRVHPLWKPHYSLCRVAFVVCFLHRQVYVIFVGNLHPSFFFKACFKDFMFSSLILRALFGIIWGTWESAHYILGKDWIGLSQCVLDSLSFLFLAGKPYCWWWTLVFCNGHRTGSPSAVFLQAWRGYLQSGSHDHQYCASSTAFESPTRTLYPQIISRFLQEHLYPQLLHNSTLLYIAIFLIAGCNNFTYLMSGYCVVSTLWLIVTGPTCWAVIFGWLLFCSLLSHRGVGNEQFWRTRSPDFSLISPWFPSKWRHML